MNSRIKYEDPEASSGWQKQGYSRGVPVPVTTPVAVVWISIYFHASIFSPPIVQKMSSIVGMAGLASTDTDPLWERQNRAAGESDCVVTTVCGVATGAWAPHGIVQLASMRSVAAISDIRIKRK
jgi:hypothetical protein